MVRQRRSRIALQGVGLRAVLLAIPPPGRRRHQSRCQARSAGSGVIEEPFERRTQSFDRVVAEARVPACVDVVEEPPVRVPRRATLRSEVNQPRPARGRVGCGHEVAVPLEETHDAVTASFDTPARTGRSRTRTPSSVSTRTTLATIASDNVDSRSNSTVKRSSTRESRADRSSGGSVPPLCGVGNHPSRCGAHARIPSA